MPFNIENSEDFNNKMEGIKHLVFAISIFLSGLWAYFTFDATLQVQNATAKLQLLENKLRQFPIMEVDLHLKEINVPNVNFSLIKVSSTIKNVGTAKANITLAEDAFSLGFTENEKIKISKFSDITYSYPFVIPSTSSEFNLARIDKLFFLPNQTHQINTVFKVYKSGLYQVGFKGEPSTHILNEAEGLNLTTHNYLIRRTKYIYIDLNKKQKVL